ncbi:MAG: hypothetical protein JNL61_06810 [Rhizobiaceae bacterium]|nr:hypothetical protein [Rhizobiaceae bacterium]
MAKAPTIEIQNFTSPGSTYRVDAAKYEAMRGAMLAALPAAEPGVTVAELKTALLPHLPAALFPGGAKAGWWLKAVQLDLEAKGLVRRTATSPLRFYRT